MSRFPMPTEQDWEQYRKEQEHAANLAACEATTSVPECIDRLRWTIVEIVRVVFETLSLCIAVLVTVVEGWLIHRINHGWHATSATLEGVLVVAAVYFTLLILSYRIERLR